MTNRLRHAPLSSFQMRPTTRSNWPRNPTDKDLDFRCDTCSKPADTVHFIPYVINEKFERIELACPKHDPGGYWLELRDMTDYSRDYDTINHIADKGASHALFTWFQYLADIRASASR